MEWHINDLSLSGQFADPQSFRLALEPLLQLRHRDPLLQSRLYCSRTLHACMVTAIYDLKHAVYITGDRTYIGLVLGWATKSGPFWDDVRQFEENDYFEYNRTDITDQGLGEAARRRLAHCNANVYSFQGTGFELSPLLVQHGLPEDPLGSVNVINHWQIEQIRLALTSCRVLSCWQDVQEEINRQFNRLIVATNVMDNLMAIPFSTYVAERIFILLNVLNRLVEETNEDGSLTENGMTLFNDHFVGEKAWFTDESEGNKIKFHQELTFLDPSDENTSIVCPFHGKIKSPQIRIHFEWPRPRGQREIKIVYIGPKITKK